MRMNTTFDTLSYTRRLEAAGVPAEQADAHAHALSEALRTQLATKADVQLAKMELNDKIELVRLELSDKIELVRTELNDKIDRVHLELSGRMDRMEAKQAAEFAELRALIRDQTSQVRTEIMRWVFGLSIGQTAVMFAALAYLRS